MTLEKLLTNARSLEQAMSGGDVARSVLEGHKADILELQRIQLLEGKASDGEDLRPYYSEDLKPAGYFWSKETAARYSAFKESLSYPYQVQRNPDVPNLYINGRFHSELDVRYAADSVAVVADTAFSRPIMAKYGVEKFGLSAEKWSEVFNGRGARDEILKKMKDILWS